MCEPERRTPVVITIDTEPDDAWTDHLNPSVANVQELRRLQKLLDRYGAKATCLVTYRVAEDERAADVLRELSDDGGAEIGAHLHPWETPPFMGSGVDVDYDTYPHELPLDFFEKKLTCLTDVITRRFCKPTSYRAGRSGWVANHIRGLEALGYIVDSSVVPWADFRANLGIPRSVSTDGLGHGGIDFRRAPRHPYHPNYSDANREGDALLLELPISVGFTRRTPPFVRTCYGAMPTLSQRVLRKAGLLRPIPAMPAQHLREELLKMIRVLLAEGAPLINISLHSSELMLDGSPRTRTKEQVEAMFGCVEALLSVLVGHGSCHFTTLSQAARTCMVDRNEAPVFD